MHFLVWRRGYNAREAVTANHAPLARRASMSCAQVETLTCDVVVNVFPASPPIISLSYKSRTNEKRRAVSLSLFECQRDASSSSSPRARSTKTPRTFGTLFPPFFALASSFARRASSSRCRASASERFSERLALFFLLLLFAFLGSDDDEDAAAGFAAAVGGLFPGRFLPPPFGFAFPLNARAMSGASAAPTRAKMTNGDVDDVFDDVDLRLVARDLDDDDDDEEEEDPELCRVAMSIERARTRETRASLCGKRNETRPTKPQCLTRPMRRRRRKHRDDAVDGDDDESRRHRRLSTYGTLERDVDAYNDAVVKRDFDVLLSRCCCSRLDASTATTTSGRRRSREDDDDDGARGRGDGGIDGAKNAGEGRRGRGQKDDDDDDSRRRRLAAREHYASHGYTLGANERTPPSANALHDVFNLALSVVLRELSLMDDATPFLVAVDAGVVPDYYDVIETPVDISSMRERLQNGGYLSKDAFAADLKLMESNAVAYNGEKSVIAKMARTVVGRGEELLSHMPRVDFSTCAREAAFAETFEAQAIAREAELAKDREEDAYASTSSSSEDDEDEDDERDRWRRVRRVFRAKALADLPVGSRRVLVARTAKGMAEFMRVSADHNYVVPMIQHDEEDDEVEYDAFADAESPEYEAFVSNAVPSVPRYSGRAIVMDDAIRAEELKQCVAKILLTRRVGASRRQGTEGQSRSVTRVAFTELAALADGFCRAAALRVAKALAMRRRTAPSPITRPPGVRTPEESFADRVNDARAAARVLKNISKSRRALGAFAQSDARRR